MAEVSDVDSKCRFIQSVSALIIRHFRKGCLCPVPSKAFAQLLAATFDLVRNANVDDQVSILSIGMSAEKFLDKF
jgi:hypothetical protein